MRAPSILSVFVWLSTVGAQVDADALRTHLDEHARDAVSYVVGKFAAHDAVLLGEHHEVRENCEFVARLVPALHAAGVDALLTEFLRTSQQDAVDSLVSGAGEQFDAALGVRLLRELSPTWGYRESLDILNAVWTVNRDRADGAPAFSVFGLDSDWQRADYLRASRAERFQTTLAREQNMVEVAEREVFERGRKALFHVGWAHSITWQGVRLGTVLRSRHGDAVFQVALHHEQPITSRLEELFAGRKAPLGFDVVDSPFAEIAVAPPHPRAPKMTFAQVGEGWVFLAPVADLRRVRWIDDFVTEATFADARFIAVKRGWLESDAAAASPAALNAVLSRHFDGQRHRGR